MTAALVSVTTNVGWDGDTSLRESTTVAGGPQQVDYAVRRVSVLKRWNQPVEPGVTKPEPEVSGSEPKATTLPIRVDVTQRSTVTVLAEWNGCVLATNGQYFTAELKGVFGEGVRGEEEDAEIPVSDVAESDSELLYPGNFFRLCVFYEIREDGQPRRYTQVVFRRLPAYRAPDLAKAAERALEIHRALRVE